MKRLFVFLLIAAVLLSAAGCVASIPENTLATMEEPYDPTVGKFPEPPKGYVVTEKGKTPLRLGGYSWTYATGKDTSGGMIADQYMWPLPLADMQTVKITADDLLDGQIYYMTDPPIFIAQGAKVTLDWQVMPDAVECTFWPSDHETTEAPARKMECNVDGFVAHMGSYIYEINAAWGNYGRGYSGKAAFYVHVVVEPSVDLTGTMPKEG